MNFPEDQSHEACLAAVQQNGYVLFYVKEQTPEICFVAYSRTPDVIRFVRDPTLKTQIQLLII